MKLIRKFLLFAFLLLLLCIAGVSILTHYYGDEIEALVVENLNKNLKTEVKVSEVNFSIWENFPYASVVFSDIVIYAVDAKNDSLLSAEKLSVKFNLIDIYNKQYKLIGLTVKNGSCKMLVDNSGRANYVFWNERDTSSTASSTFSIELKNVSISDMQYSYIDYAKDNHIAFLIKSAKAKGNFQESIFEMNLDAKLEKTILQFDKTSLFEDRTLYLELEGNVNQLEEQVNFISSNLGVDDMNIDLDGFLTFDERNFLQLSLKSANTELDKTIALLPQSVQKELKRFDLDGDATFNGSVVGSLSSPKPPAYSFNFTVENGSFDEKDSQLSFKNTSLKGSVSNGEQRTPETTAITLSHFETYLNGGKMDGMLFIQNFKNPYYQYEGNITFQLADAIKLFKWEELTNPNGSIYSQLKIEGKLADVGKYDLNDWKRSKINGEVVIEDLSFKLKDHVHFLKKTDALLEFNNSSIEVKNLNGILNNNELLLTGKFNNLISFLLNEKEPLFVDARLRSPKINLGSLLISNKENGNDQYELDISPRITVYLDAKVDSLEFENFLLSDLNTVFVMKQERIDARNISFSSQEGRFEGDLFIREQGKDDLSIFCQADLIDVNVRKLFKSFNNFGQNSIRSENIEGIVNAEVKFNSKWTKQFEIDTKTIKVETDFVIDEGKLINFKPLESLSRFVELEELKEISFRQLKNHLLIENEVITIPRFDIFSSAMNLSLAGTHTFDNQIDYRITLLLSDLLGRKAKKANDSESEFGYIEEDGLKGSKVFLKMTGSVDNPSIGYDTRELRRTLKKKLIEEKNTFKRLLKEELGLFKKDSIPRQPAPEKKQSPFQIEIDSSYIKDNTNGKGKKSTEKNTDEDKASQNKSRFGKFLDKIAKPNEEEFVEPIEN